MTLIESLRTWFAACPLLKDGLLNVEYLGADGFEYTISADQPVNPVLRKYTSGSSVRQFPFVFASKEKYLTAMNWFTEVTPKDTGRAFKALSDFSLCKDLPRCGKKAEGQGSDKPCLSWKYDAPFIIGAFRQIYGIDLLKCKMHWYEFFALFMALPDDTPVKYRMAMRQINPADIKDNSRRSEIRRIQRAIAIPCGEMSAYKLGEAFM